MSIRIACDGCGETIRVEGGRPADGAIRLWDDNPNYGLTETTYDFDSWACVTTWANRKAATAVVTPPPEPAPQEPVEPAPQEPVA